MKAVNWRERAERLEAWIRNSVIAPVGISFVMIEKIISETEKEYADVHGTALYPLFEHMVQEHGLTFTDSQLNEIIHVVAGMRAQQANAPYDPGKVLFSKDGVQGGDMVELAHNRIDKVREDFEAFKQRVEQRFDAMADFAESVGKWARAERRQRGL